jgi:hypothetical protein
MTTDTKLWHVVIYRLMPGVTRERVQEIRDLFAAGVGQFDGLDWARSATNNSHSPRAAGWTEGVVLQFRDEAARDAYLQHPIHHQIEEAVGDTFYADAVVFDMNVAVPVEVQA